MQSIWIFHTEIPQFDEIQEKINQLTWSYLG